MSADKQFDPDNVERCQPWISTGISDSIVRADDYDQLLALYHELRAQLSTSEVANGMQMEKYRL